RKPEVLLAILAVFLVGALAGVWLGRVGVPGLDDPPPRKIEEALDLIQQRYVDDRSANDLAAAAIDGMVDLLDPYSIYIDARTIGPIQDELEGEFGGVGIWFEMVSDSARVVSVIAGGPSDAVGVRAGDRIVAIDDSSCVGENSLSIQRRIRGPAGEPVDLTIYRPLLRQQFDVTVERAEIPIRSVEAAFRTNERRGYVRISRFTAGTADEFRRSVSELMDEGPLDGLLIDVRDNPGGIMEAAVLVADEMLPSGSRIVSTEGRGMDEHEIYTASDGGLLEDVAILILVNQNSASASEILAGAIQDNDRGLVVGRPTFGKGLVQRQFMFSDGSALQLTVARYYTPSGRPIQNDLDRDVPTHFGVQREEPIASEEPDSLIRFRTVHGREVLGGKGIYPDHVVSEDSTVSFFDLTFRTGLDLGFGRRWFDTHEPQMRESWSAKQEDFASGFVVTDEMWRDFLEYARDEAGPVYGDYGRSEIEQSRDRVSMLLKARIAQSLFGPYMWFSIVSDVDPEISFAHRFWDEATSLPGLDSHR
ncbi:MAG: S41 family peptidase, partial [Rhodothermales bacterium]|nr:S41 family peptidase [Rhodothermales bacterium]